jgi:Sodium/hydrogen exchanger family
VRGGDRCLHWRTLLAAMAAPCDLTTAAAAATAASATATTARLRRHCRLVLPPPPPPLPPSPSVVRYGRASFGILLLQDLAVVPLLVAIPLLAGTGGSMAKALTSAAAKACIALGVIAFLGQNVLDRLFFLVARSRSQEAFLAVILLTVMSMSSLTEGLGLSNTLGAFLAGVLLSETKYRYQVSACSRAICSCCTSQYTGHVILHSILVMLTLQARDSCKDEVPLPGERLQSCNLQLLRFIYV